MGANVDVTLKKKKWNKFIKIGILLLLAILVYSGYAGGRVCVAMWRWNTYRWVPRYLLMGASQETVPDSEKHLIFVMVDHYEHFAGGVIPQAVENNRIWCEKFRQISDKYRDNYGNKFRYTWFYPYDHHIDGIMYELSDMALHGYGEVEMHWHLPTDGTINPQTYPQKLHEALEWYHQFGAMITEEETPRTAFAYVSGNWDLDASQTPKSNGLTNQITVLHKSGCYADFTFSTINSNSQPRKINSIYYVVDDPNKPKSHDTGIDAKIGKQPTENQFMIFEGPTTINWHGRLEYGAIESDLRFKPERIPKWMEANIHVKGRPEWVFVKVYSHGAQSQKIVLAHDMEYMLQSLQQYSKEHKIQLHFMTAREAYNVVKAAESGKSGNPEDYRDFFIPKYQNMIRSFQPPEIFQSNTSNDE
ncbi:MAG: hypothetical protein LBJ67_08350 [Planctomycetaceae bacterium]|jgi:hypothetical protein|nr:hypothetical protein [Planctomycetaceae bacterium]